MYMGDFMWTVEGQNFKIVQNFFFSIQISPKIQIRSFRRNYAIVLKLKLIEYLKILKFFINPQFLCPLNEKKFANCK